MTKLKVDIIACNYKLLFFYYFFLHKQTLTNLQATIKTEQTLKYFRLNSSIGSYNFMIIFLVLIV